MSDGVSSWHLATSTLLPVVVEGISNPSAIIVDRLEEGAQLYIANWGNDSISSWVVGSPTTAATQVVTSGVSGPIALEVVDHTLYIVNYNTNSVAAWPIGSSTTASTVITDGISRPTSIAYDLNRNRFYIGNAGNGGTVVAWEPDQGDTTYTVVRDLPSVGALVFDHEKDTLYIANHKHNTVSAWGPNFGETATVVISDGLNAPESLAFNGTVLYIGNRESNAVDAWEVDSGFTSTPIITGFDCLRGLAVNELTHELFILNGTA